MGWLYQFRQYLCKNYAHVCVFCYGLVLVDFTHIFQGDFTEVGAIKWLPQLQLNNHEEYG